MTNQPGAEILAMAFAVDAARDRQQGHAEEQITPFLLITLINESDGSARILRVPDGGLFTKRIIDAYYAQFGLYVIPADSLLVATEGRTFIVSRGDGTSHWREHIKATSNSSPIHKISGVSMPTTRLSFQESSDRILEALTGYTYGEACAVLDQTRDTIDKAAHQMVVFTDSVREIRALAEQSTRELRNRVASRQ